MIILKVKDAETDEDSLEMPEWMNNTHDIESDGSESSSDFNPELLTDTSSDTSSDCSCILDDVAKDLDEYCNNDDQDDEDNSLDNAPSSLSDDMDDEIDGLELFPAYHLPDNMDTSDDEETAMARGYWFWYLYDKGYVTFPVDIGRDTDSEDKSGASESTSDTEEKSKIADDSKLSEPLTTEKTDTAPDETKAEKTTLSMIQPFDA